MNASKKWKAPHLSLQEIMQLTCSKQVKALLLEGLLDQLTNDVGMLRAKEATMMSTVASESLMELQSNSSRDD